MDLWNICYVLGFVLSEYKPLKLCDVYDPRKCCENLRLSFIFTGREVGHVFDPKGIDQSGI